MKSSIARVLNNESKISDQSARKTIITSKRSWM